MLSLLTLVLVSQLDDDMPGAIVRRQPPPPPRPCEVELVLKVRRGASAIRLEGQLRNRSDRPQTLTMQGRCPNPPLIINGLPEGVHAFDTCAMGPCVTNEPVTVTLAAGQSVKIGEGVLTRTGGACSKPFVGGPHQLSMAFGAVGEVPQLCGGEPVAVRGFSEPRPPPEAKLPHPAPAPAKRCPDVACGGCPGGYAPSADGCPSCECLQGPALKRP